MVFEETRVPGQNHRLVAMFYQVHPTSVGFELTTLVVIVTGYIGSCKSNYHRIMTTSTPKTLNQDFFLLFK